MSIILYTDKIMTKRHVIIVVSTIAFVTLIGVVLFSGKGKKSGGEAVSVDETKYVKVQKVNNDTVPVIVTGFGRVASVRRVTLSSEAQGVLMNTGFNLKAGQSFSKGQLLFKVNDRENRLALKARKSTFLNLMATVLPDIKIDFPESAVNWAGFLDKIDLDKNLPVLPEFSSSKEKTFLAAKNVLTEYYNIKGDEEKLGRHAVYAPFNGTIIEVLAEEGTNLAFGSQVATIIKTVAMEIAIPVDPSNISLIKKGHKVNLFTDNKNQHWEGKVIRIAQSINENTQSVDVYVSIKNDSKRPLYNGIYLEAEILAGELYNAIEIPRRALLDDGTVYAVKDSLLVVRTPEILKRNKKTVIVKGLLNEDLIVIEPISGVVGKMKVAPVNNKL